MSYNDNSTLLINKQFLYNKLPSYFIFLSFSLFISLSHLITKFTISYEDMFAIDIQNTK